jgi:hypothetical protein
MAARKKSKTLSASVALARLDAQFGRKPKKAKVNPIYDDGDSTLYGKLPSKMFVDKLYVKPLHHDVRPSSMAFVESALA